MFRLAEVRMGPRSRLLCGVIVAAVLCAAAARGAAANLRATGAQAPAAPHSSPLTVTRGSGGGDDTPNSVVHVWADPAPPGTVFDRWDGDVAPLIDRYAAHTTLVMPRSKVAIEAAFKPGPACNPVTETVNGATASWCLPAGQKALILLFHGHEANGVGFFRATESRIFAAEAAAAGFGLIALDSAERQHKVWEFRGPGSPDVRNIRAVLGELARRHEISGKEPLFGLGVNHGGTFAMHAAKLLRLHAVALFGGAGKLPEGYATPTIWLMTQNAVDRGPRVLEEYTSLTASGTPAKLEVNDASPVYPLRFWRIVGITPDESRAIHQLLVDKGYLDARDMLKQDPETSGWEIALPPRLAKMRGLLREQLDVCFPGPRFYSDFDHRILDFFRPRR
jgi:hypothetical protein